MAAANLEPAFHLDFSFNGKGWEVWSFDHDQTVMTARFEYQRTHPVPGRSVRLLGPKGDVLLFDKGPEKK